MTRTLVVTDLDGTLWDNDLRCHPDISAAVAEFQADDDVTLLAATGRRRNSARKAMNVNGFVLPAILLNGATGYDFESEALFHQITFAQEVLAEVVGLLEGHGLGPVAYLTDTRALVVSGVTTSLRHLDSLGDDLVWSTHAELGGRSDVMGMSMLGIDAEHVAPALAALEADPRAEVVGYADHLYPPFSFMVAPPGITKAVGIEAFVAHRGLEPQRVVAVGDGGNDLAMLAMADLAIAVEGADPRALELADVVIPRPHDGGWAQVLDYV